VIGVRSPVQCERSEQVADRPSGSEACLVCGRRGADGPIILGRRLCARCEQAIVKLDVADRDYGFFVARIRDAWRAYTQAQP